MGNRQNGDVSVSLLCIILRRFLISDFFFIRQMLKTIQEKYGDFFALENAPNDTSKAYKVPGFSGQVGFITSMTEHFCGSCNRLRITADGNLKVSSIDHFS